MHAGEESAVVHWMKNGIQASTQHLIIDLEGANTAYNWDSN